MSLSIFSEHKTEKNSMVIHGFERMSVADDQKGDGLFKAVSLYLHQTGTFDHLNLMVANYMAGKMHRNAEYKRQAEDYLFFCCKRKAISRKHKRGIDEDCE